MITAFNDELLVDTEEGTGPAFGGQVETQITTFKLKVGTTYITSCKERVLIAFYNKKLDLYFGVVVDETTNNQNTTVVWYSQDGSVLADAKRGDWDDPLNIVSEYRPPDRIYRLKRNGVYTHNTVFMTLENAQKVAAESGGTVVRFTEDLEELRNI